MSGLSLPTDAIKIDVSEELFYPTGSYCELLPVAFPTLVLSIKLANLFQLMPYAVLCPERYPDS